MLQYCTGKSKYYHRRAATNNIHISSRDPRNPAAPLRVHSSTHSDDITAVHFSKSQSNVLLSASSDGLVCTSNADEDDEDEAGLHVGNVGSSVAQAGWINGTDGTPTVWAGSDMETFSTWSDEVADLLCPYSAKSLIVVP